MKEVFVDYEPEMFVEKTVKLPPVLPEIQYPLDSEVISMYGDGYFYV